MGYVERNASGRTELRVHGVAGTAPESVLSIRTPNRSRATGTRGSSGDGGRPESVSADTPRRRREAYSWGGLTSGDNTRALWLLLLPFMLLNVAFYMAPYRRPPGRRTSSVASGGSPGDGLADAARDRRRDRFSASVQRLLALSFTAHLHPHRDHGGDGPGRLEVRGGPARARRVRDVLAGLAGRLGVAGPAGAAGGRDCARPARGGRAALVARRRDMGQAGAGRLPPRTLPCAASRSRRRSRTGRCGTAGPGPAAAGGARRDGLALPGVFALARAGGRAGRPPVLLVLVAFLLAMVLVVVHPTIARPGAAVPRGTEPGGHRRAAEPVPVPALDARRYRARARRGGDGHGGRPARRRAAPPRSGPPCRGWRARCSGLFVVQAGAARVAARWPAGACGGGPGGHVRRPDTAEKRRVGLRPAWRGYAMPAIAMLAWVLAGGFSAGIVLRAARDPRDARRPRVPGTTTRTPSSCPLAYRWVAAAAFALAVTAVLSAVFVWLRLTPVEAADGRRRAAYGAAADGRQARTEEIARSVGPGDAR